MNGFYLKDISNTDWVQTSSRYINLGCIGDLSNYDYTSAALNSIENFKKNLQILNDIISKLNHINSYAISFVIRSGESVYSLDKHILINNTTNGYELLEHIYFLIDSLSMKYSFTSVDSLSIKLRSLTVKVKDPNFKSIKSIATLPNSSSTKLFSNKLIPFSFNLKYYGELLSLNDGYLFKYNNNYIKVYINSNDSHSFSVFNEKRNLVKGNDYLLDKGNNFIRELIIGSQICYIEYSPDQKIINVEYQPKVRFIKGLNKEYIKEFKSLTFDLECYLDDSNNFIPYSCGFYDGKICYRYYLTDFTSVDEMLINCINDMLKPKYHNFKVYCHNFGKYDYIFIRKLLLQKYNGSIIVSKDLTVLSISINNGIKGKNRINLIFRDSLALLPLSLHKLGISYEVDVLKGIFPYRFVKSNNLDYIGNKPSISLYEESAHPLYKEIAETHLPFE